MRPMSSNPRRRSAIIVVILVLLGVVALFFLMRCRGNAPAPTTPNTSGAPATAPSGEPGRAPPPASEVVPESLTPAMLTSPERVTAGAAFTVGWNGPDNPADFVTVVRVDASAEAIGNYKETREGASLELTAPIEPGAYEVRYVTGRSRTILGRAPIEVVAADAALDAPAEVTLGSTFSVSWTGPNNTGDFITIVRDGAADSAFTSYESTARGSPVTLAAPPDPCDAEIRYVSGQGRKVLARRPIKVMHAVVTLDAPAEVIAGTTIDVAWVGPNNVGDYITVVPVETPDGKYANYANTSQGSPLRLLMPIMDGDAELRYMTGQGHRVLARRAIRVVAAKVTLAAPAECEPGAEVSVEWTGPNNPGDYITIVPKDEPDGRYGAYTNTTAGSPLKVKAPAQACDAEIRYMTGQGGKVLARVPIKVGR